MLDEFEAKPRIPVYSMFLFYLALDPSMGRTHPSRGYDLECEDGDFLPTSVKFDTEGIRIQ